MSIAYNTSNVRDGLVLHLDPANIKSYNPNLLQYSQTFTTGYWNVSNVDIVSTTETAPDGTPTATVLEDNTTSAYRHMSVSFAIPNDDQTYTISMYVKKTVAAPAKLAVNVNLSGGTTVSSNPRINTNTGVTTGGTNTTVNDAGTYWRMSWTSTNNSSGNTSLTISVYPAAQLSDVPGDTTTAVGTATVWGIMITRGNDLIDYSPNSGASSNIWYDLCKNRNYTMYGTVPYLPEAGGCWDFTSLESGSAPTSPLGFTTTGGIPFGNLSSFSITSWVYQTTNASQTGLISNASGADGFRFGPANGGIYYLVGPTHKEGTLGIGTMALNQWTMLTAVYDRQGQLNGNPTVFGYINNNFVGSDEQNPQTSAITTAPGIVRSACCQRFIGKLGLITIHEKPLSAQEVHINFESVRRRYGL